MKKLIASLLLIGACLGACHSAPPPNTRPVLSSDGSLAGAPDALAAVRSYLKSVESQDLQAMGGVWGGPDGPARDLLPQNELYQREIVMMCTLKHDRYDVVGDAPNAGGGRSIVVNLFSGGDSHPRTFDVVQGPKGRWFVRSVDVKTLTTCGKG